MKILVVDDQQEQRENACALLKNHSVTTASGWSETCGLLFSEKTGNKNPHGFEVVLTDLMMPAEAKGLASDPRGKLVPYGVLIALFAMRCEIEKVAIVSNGNHHEDPILWSFDALYGMNLNEHLWVFSGGRCPCMEGKDKYHLKNWEKIMTTIFSNDPKEWGKYEGDWLKITRYLIRES